MESNTVLGTSGRQMDRDAAFELAVLRNAAESVGLIEQADSLHAFACKRILPGAINLADGRDLVQEALEEVADCIGAYVIWRLQQLMEDQVEDDHEAAYLQEAMRHGILMYAALRKAGQDS